MYKFLAILVCFMLITQISYAHPPSAMTLTYSTSKQAFTLNINHRVAEDIL